MIENKYSKFKYENKYNLKFSVNQYTQQPSVLNVNLRTIKPNIGSKFLEPVVHLNVGQTFVTDYVYSCTQVNFVDQPVAINTVKKIFFKLFNLS